MNGEDKYQIFKLKNKEFTFTVDMSTLPCGLNGAPLRSFPSVFATLIRLSSDR